MQYEWNSAKNQANIDERGIEFERVYGLDWGTVIEAQDTRAERDEVRMVAFGLIENRLYCLVYTMRSENCRVISLRKANRREVLRYGQAHNYHTNA